LCRPALLIIEGWKRGKSLMKKLILTLFAAMLACSPLLAEDNAGKTTTTHSQVGKAKNKKHHKKKKKANKKAQKSAKKKKSASPKAEAA